MTAQSEESSLSAVAPIRSWCFSEPWIFLWKGREIPSWQDSGGSPTSPHHLASFSSPLDLVLTQPSHGWLLLSGPWTAFC